MPPADLNAEGNVLGQCLLVPSDIDLVIGWGLQPAHFYADANRRIFDSILTVHGDSSMVVDIIAVSADLRNKSRLDQVGGTPYLAMLSDTYPVNAEKQLQHHCRIIMDHWRARQAISIQQVSVAALYQPMGSKQLQDTLESVEQHLWEVTHEQRSASYENAGLIANRALNELQEAIASGKSIVGVTTGFADLDEQTAGYHDGDLVLIAARPGAGKSSFLTSSLIRSTRVPTNGTDLPEAAYLHSLEMPKEQVALRLACSQAGVEFQRLRLNQLNRQDWAGLFAACAVLKEQPLIIDDQPAITVMEFRSNVRRIKREIEIGRIKAKGLKIASVDYLQLMTGEKGQGREREIASISSGLKNLAKSEKLCVIALSQLNRNVEKRGGEKGKRPEMSDLRESGSQEMDADAVWFLYRPKYYDKDAEDDAELIIAKQRNGPTCTVMLGFDGPSMTFKPLLKGYEELQDFGEPAGPGYYSEPDEAPRDEEWYQK